MAKAKNKDEQRPVKTIEFKAYLTPRQEEKANQWLRTLRSVWNKGLSMLNELDEHRQFHKPDKKCYPCSPIGWKYHWEKDDDGKWQLTRPYCDLRRRSCLLPGVTPELENASYINLCKAFAKKNHPNDTWLQDVPNDFIRGTLNSLSKAWEEYRKGNRKPPRYKGQRHPITSLVNEDAKATKLYHRRCPISKEFGMVLTDRSLLERWPLQDHISVVKLCKKADGWYLQLSGPVPYTLPEPTDTAIGIDPGLKYVIATSDGETVDPPKFLRQSEKRLARLQRRVSRRQKGSNRHQKAKDDLARLHKKIADQRRLFNHALSTRLVSEHGAIVAEDLPITNLNRKPKKKEREDGKGYAQNGAKRKAGLNKSFADIALGQLLEMIKTKAKATGREFVRVAPHYTSQECNNCKAIVKKTLSQRTHRCPECGYIEDRDINAAKNILERGLPLLIKTYKPSVKLIGKIPPLPASGAILKGSEMAYPTCLGKVTDGETVSRSVAEPSINLEHRQCNSRYGAFDVLPGLDLSLFESSKTTRKRRKTNTPRKPGSESFLQLGLGL